MQTKKNRATSVSTMRVQSFWRGDWQHLWEDAHIKSQAAKPIGGAKDEADAETISERVKMLLASGEVAKALKLATSKKN